MIYIRKTTNGEYRQNEWGHLFNIQYAPDGRDLWVVEFPDGAKDVWPSWDLDAGYDVRIQIEHPEVPSGNQVNSERRIAARSAAEHLFAQVTERQQGLQRAKG